MAKKEKKQLNDEIKMVSAITEALEFKRTNKDQEKVLRHITEFVKKEKNKKTKMEMIAAASKAVEISEKESYLTDREIIKKIMPDLKDIIKKVD